MGGREDLEDLGKIHRSAGFGVQECRRRRERKEEEEGEETRIRSQGIRMWWGSRGCRIGVMRGLRSKGKENITLIPGFNRG